MNATTAAIAAAPAGWTHAEPGPEAPPATVDVETVVVFGLTEHGWEAVDVVKPFVGLRRWIGKNLWRLAPYVEWLENGDVVPCVGAAMVRDGYARAYCVRPATAALPNIALA